MRFALTPPMWSPAAAPSPSHAVQTAVCARMAGLETVLVLSRPEPGLPCGNILLHRLLGVTPRYVDHYKPDDLERPCGIAATG